MPDDPDPGSDTAALVVAAQSGDTLALNYLLDRLIPYVARICAAIALGNGSDAAQNALIVLVRSLPALREPAAVFGWARTIAVREAVRQASRSTPGLAAHGGALTEVPAPGDPQLAVDVADVLSRLSPQHRAVLVLRDLEGLDETSAAKLLQLPAGTVKSRLHRARRMFRKEWTS